MKLPVCKVDIESDILCPSCQDKLDNGEITEFDIDFSKWLLTKVKEYPGIEDLNVIRAVKVEDRAVLVVKKPGEKILQQEEELLEEMEEEFGSVLILEGPAKLRAIVRRLIAPAVEVGINSLYLPDGTKESIVVLREQDRHRIKYTKEELRQIVSAVTGEHVLFEYQDERIKEKEEEEELGILDEKLKKFTKRRA